MATLPMTSRIATPPTPCSPNRPNVLLFAFALVASLALLGSLDPLSASSWTVQSSREALSRWTLAAGSRVSEDGLIIADFPPPAPADPPPPHPPASAPPAQNKHAQPRPQRPAHPVVPPVEDVPEKPICTRTMFYPFTGTHGFASEYTSYVRARAVAEHFNYTVIVDDVDWNYGSLANYFKVADAAGLAELKGGCELPSDWKTRTRRPMFGVSKPVKKVNGPPVAWELPDEADLTPWGVEKIIWEVAKDDAWAEFDHVYYDRAAREVLDARILSLDVDLSTLTYLHAADFYALDKLWQAQTSTDPTSMPPVPLDPTQTLNPVYAPAFARQALQLRSSFTPNDQLESDIAQLDKTLFGAGSKPARGKRRTASEVVISVHFRQGDKRGEVHRISPIRYATAAWGAARKFQWRRLHWPYERLPLQTSIPLFLDAAERALANLVVEGLVEAEEEDAAEAQKPTLVIISDNPDAADLFRRHPRSEGWTILGTSAAPLPTVPVAVSRPRWRKRGSRLPALPGFVEHAFNKLGTEERVRLARGFLRDLVWTARTSDAIVMTPTSNVGRLWTVIFGSTFVEEGDTDAEKAVGEARKRIWSADVRWFPTARFY